MTKILSWKQFSPVSFSTCNPETFSEMAAFTQHSPGTLLLLSQTDELGFTLSKAALMNSPVFDYAEIKVRQVSGTERLQQSNNFAIIIFFVCFCNLGEGAEGGKNSVSVLITWHPTATTDEPELTATVISDTRSGRIFSLKIFSLISFVCVCVCACVREVNSVNNQDKEVISIPV